MQSGEAMSAGISRCAEVPGEPARRHNKGIRIEGCPILPFSSIDRSRGMEWSILYGDHYKIQQSQKGVTEQGDKAYPVVQVKAGYVKVHWKVRPLLISTAVGGNRATRLRLFKYRICFTCVLKVPIRTNYPCRNTPDSRFSGDRCIQKPSAAQIMCT